MDNYHHDERGRVTPFDVRIEHIDDGCVQVAVIGDVDMTTADQLHRALEAADAQATGDTVLDLAGLSFIDSSGMRVLLVFARRARRLSRRVRAVNTPQGVARLFELTALDKSIEVTVGGG